MKSCLDVVPDEEMANQCILVPCVLSVPSAQWVRRPKCVKEPMPDPLHPTEYPTLHPALLINRSSWYPVLSAMPGIW